jgi:hypothetical protein
MPFIGESPWITKSARGIELAQKSEAISHMERPVFLFQKEKKMAIDVNVTVR